MPSKTCVCYSFCYCYKAQTKGPMQLNFEMNLASNLINPSTHTCESILEPYQLKTGTHWNARLTLL